ncbi:PE family protein [Mycobacterium sp. Marseille-P9652]|uniref:PE family protein n=1 Tax=Mycobacterium sp. Marseille-P9652 TaxID=2654950 RepID=UPI0012E87CD5|nr:PE family protein [Mycobacterium sp. Marseille-P9652]
MSFLFAVPEEVQAAAQNLAGIRDSMAEASAAAATPTASVAAAAEDQVSTGVAAFFGAFGQEYQVISAQVQSFHEQFVNMLSAGGAAYLSTEVANAEQNLLNGAPAQGLLNSVGGAVSEMGEGVSGLASGTTAAAGIPLLGGGGLLSPILSGGSGTVLGGGATFGSLLGGLSSGSVTQGVTGIVAALQNGTAASLFSGQLGPSLQGLSAQIAALPTMLQSYAGGLGPSLLHAGASTGNAAGPYQTLLDHTLANLQLLRGSLAANPAPFLHQFIANATGYANTIAADLQYVIQNFPALLAGLPANIQAAIQALLAFNPGPYVQQFIQNQMMYAHIIATSLQSAGSDFLSGLQGLPAAFQAAYQALLTGDIGGAFSDISQGLLNLFITGVDVTSTGSISPIFGGTILASVTPTGTIGDLLPILTIPGMRAQNFTNLLPTGSIPAHISQNFTNVINTLTDTSLTATIKAGSFLSNLSLTATAGLPVALTIEALGAPFNAVNAFAGSASQFVGQLQTGDFGGAITTLVDAPALVTDAFLNGQSTLPITFDVGGLPATLNLPMNGLLAPVTPYTAAVNIGGGAITLPVGGTPISGLATGLSVYAPAQLASAIAP